MSASPGPLLSQGEEEAAGIPAREGLAGRQVDVKSLRIVMALENNAYPDDVRVRAEASQLAREGHEVLVLAPRRAGQSRAEVIDGVRVRRFWSPEGQGIAGLIVEYTVAVPQLVIRVVAALLRGTQVVHLHNPPDLLFPAALAARILGRGVVFDHHDLAPELFADKFGNGRMVAVLRACERLTMRSATVVLAANESHRRIAVERDGVPPARVAVVRNAPRRETIVADAVTRPGVLRDPRLCYLGSLGAQDGVRLLPEVLSRLRSAGYRPHLLVVGDGPGRAWIAALAEERGVADAIEFTGHVEHERVPALLSRADICIDVAPGTALNHRSTMIKIGEYLAAGKPVVSFALDETLATAGDAILSVPCDLPDELVMAIVRLSRSEELRKRLAQAALARAREITWERSADALRNAYALVADSASRAPVSA